MSIWSVADVGAEPSTTLARWQVMRMRDTGDRHLVGWAVEARERRVSSAVATWDPGSRLATTGSGRVYELAGKPGEDADAGYAWQRWLARYGHPAWDDVTEDVAQEIASAASVRSSGP